MPRNHCRLKTNHAREPSAARKRNDLKGCAHGYQICSRNTVLHIGSGTTKLRSHSEPNALSSDPESFIVSDLPNTLLGILREALSPIAAHGIRTTFWFVLFRARKARLAAAGGVA